MAATSPPPSEPTEPPERSPWAQPSPDDSSQPPRCYKHRDRETYVSCVRCGRPICPDCMRPAAVGFQCPEEMRGSGEGPGGRGPAPRPPRTQLGGQVAPGRPGLVTQILIGLCVAAYVLQGAPGLGLSSSTTFNKFTYRFDLDGFAIADQHQYYRLLTAAFLHASLLHILFNMYALYLLGFELERVLGRARYLALFVVCAVGGSTLSFVVHGRSTASLGASTAIFGFFAAYYLIARRLRADTSSILIIVGINLVITFLVGSIDKFGHIGGLVTGLVVGAIYVTVPARQRALQAVLVGAVLAALVVIVMLRIESLPAVVQ